MNSSQARRERPDEKKAQRKQGPLRQGRDGSGRIETRSDNPRGHASRTWQVTDSGRWCVKIPWPRAQDDWCRYMFKLGDKYYGVRSLSDEAPAYEFEFSK
jgi:hypothetical protein